MRVFLCTLLALGVLCFETCCVALLAQLVSQWSDVGSVHVDDFLGCGSDQMLLVFKDDGKASRRPLERFLLTDLCGISYAVRPVFLISFSCNPHDGER